MQARARSEQEGNKRQQPAMLLLGDRSLLVVALDNNEAMRHKQGGATATNRFESKQKGEIRVWQ